MLIFNLDPFNRNKKYAKIWKKPVWIYEEKVFLLIGYIALTIISSPRAIFIITQRSAKKNAITWKKKTTTKCQQIYIGPVWWHWKMHKVPHLQNTHWSCKTWPPSDDEYQCLLNHIHNRICNKNGGAHVNISVSVDWGFYSKVTIFHGFWLSVV